MKNKYISHISLLVTTLLLSACLGKKDSNVSPHITWVVSGALTESDEQIQQELSDWFSPFKNEKDCASVRFYPQVEVIRLDMPESKPVKLISIDPQNLAAANVNWVKKLFGAKPKFEKLTELASDIIKTTRLPDSLKTKTENPKQEEKLRNEIALKKNALLISRELDKPSENNTTARTQLLTSAEIKIGNDTELFRAALSKQLCNVALNKQTLPSIFLFNLGRANAKGIVETKPEPPQKIEIHIPEKSKPVIELPHKTESNPAPKIKPLIKTETKVETRPPAKPTGEDDYVPALNRAVPIKNPKSN